MPLSRYRACSLDRDRQSVRLKLAAEPDKGLEHARRRRGIRARVVSYASDQLDPVARHRAVMAIQPPPQPGVFWLPVPDNHHVWIQQPRVARHHSIQPASHNGRFCISLSTHAASAWAATIQQDARAPEYQSLCVTIACCCLRARSAVMCGRGIELNEIGDGTDQGILSGVLE
jgi:hypothetical protein